MFIFSPQFFLFIRDASKATPLHEAAAHGNEKVVDLLLSDSYKAHINAENMWQVCRLNLLQLMCEPVCSSVKTWLVAMNPELFHL